MTETPALTERVGYLVPLIGVTDCWEVNLKIPAGGCVCGGLASDAETRALIPWATRDAELRRLAQENTKVGTEDDEEAPPMTTRFRRAPAGALPEAVCLTANQIRTMLQEAGNGLYGGDAGWFSLRRALRYNLRIEPTLFPLLRKGGPLATPDGIMDLPRTIRKPPYERSVVQRPEFVRGPVEVEFVLAAARWAGGRIITGEILQALLAYAGSMIGLGSHRGIDSTPAGDPGIFEVTYFERADPATLLPPGFTPPKLEIPAKAASARARKAAPAATSGDAIERDDEH